MYLLSYMCRSCGSRANHHCVSVSCQCANRDNRRYVATQKCHRDPAAREPWASSSCDVGEWLLEKTLPCTQCASELLADIFVHKCEHGTRSERLYDTIHYTIVSDYLFVPFCIVFNGISLQVVQQYQYVDNWHRDSDRICFGHGHGSKRESKVLRSIKARD